MKDRPLQTQRQGTECCRKKRKKTKEIAGIWFYFFRLLSLFSAKPYVRFAVGLNRHEKCLCDSTPVKWNNSEARVSFAEQGNKNRPAPPA